MPETFNWFGTQHLQFQGLLSDIRTHPEDLSLRLILADWLQEHADLLPGSEAESSLAWARLIRLQCARVRSRAHPTAEERDLLTEHMPHWLENLSTEAITLEWREGFVHLSGSCADLYQAIRDCDEAIFTRILWLQPTGSGQSRSRYLEHLLSLSQLSGLGVLDLSMLSSLGGPAARVLARSPHLGGLRHLNARGVGFETAEFGHLAASSFLNLHSLDLGYNPGGDEGALALADSPMTQSLRVLRLQRIALTDAGAEALLESPHLHNLQELSLYGNPNLSQEMAGRLEARFGLGFTW